MPQTARTKAKIRENLGLLKQFLEAKYGLPIDEETETTLFNALSWTADDVYDQDHAPAEAETQDYGEDVLGYQRGET